MTHRHQLGVKFTKDIYNNSSFSEAELGHYKQNINISPVKPIIEWPTTEKIFFYSASCIFLFGMLALIVYLIDNRDSTTIFILLSATDEMGYSIDSMPVMFTKFGTPLLVMGGIGCMICGGFLAVFVHRDNKLIKEECEVQVPRIFYYFSCMASIIIMILISLISGSAELGELVIFGLDIFAQYQLLELSDINNALALNNWSIIDSHPNKTIPVNNRYKQLVTANADPWLEFSWHSLYVAIVLFVSTWTLLLTRFVLSVSLSFNRIDFYIFIAIFISMLAQGAIFLIKCLQLIRFDKFLYFSNVFGVVSGICVIQCFNVCLLIFILMID